MGNNPTKIEIGSKSSRMEALDLGEDGLDYKNPINANVSKKELYELFMDDKLVHISKMNEAEDKIDLLVAKIKGMQRELDNYKHLNKLPSGVSPPDPLY